MAYTVCFDTILGFIPERFLALCIFKNILGIANVEGQINLKTDSWHTKTLSR